jgi:hypothetical protein
MHREKEVPNTSHTKQKIGTKCPQMFPTLRIILFYILFKCILLFFQIEILKTKDLADFTIWC